MKAAKLLAGMTGITFIFLCVFGSAPVWMLGAGAFLLSLSYRPSNPSNPKRPKPRGFLTMCADREPEDPSDPYSAPVAFEQAFGTDPLAPMASAIGALQRDHAQGSLTSEQLADCIENIEVVASARPRDEYDPFHRMRKQYAARTAKPKRKQTLEDVYASLVKLEGNARAAERAINDMKAMYSGTDSPGKIAVLERGARKRCAGCQTVYTNGGATPIGRYCDGSCNKLGGPL